MRESFTNKIETTPSQSPAKQEVEKAAPEKIEEFLDREAEILAAYGMKGDITLERGNNGWAFDFEHKRLIYDPNFFKERGYNLKETLFATTHELMAHYGELLRDPDFVLKEARRYSKEKPHLHLLYNIFEDVLGNRRIVAELPFLEETQQKLYKEKMFPPTDYRVDDKGNPLSRHVQFAYSFIREAMVPDEATQIDPEVREALKKLREFGTDKIDILDLVTTPTIEPKDRFKIMRRIVEPAYLELYKKDLEQEKKNKGGKKQGEGESQGSPTGASKQPAQEEGKEDKRWWQRKKQEGKGKEKSEKKETSTSGKETGHELDRKAREEAQKRFKKEYEMYEKTHPEPLPLKDEEKLKKAIEEAMGRQGGEPTLDTKILEQWAREYGLNPEDVLGYRKEYQEVAPLVAELREVFKKIVSRRLKERWRLTPQLKREGEELEEGALAESYIESKAGGEPRAFKELERAKRESEGYGVLDMTLINDLSGSMEGVKLEMDRKSKLLFLESLADFQKEIKEAEYESGIPLGLEVRTETRAFGDFGDAELKPLSPELSEKERINIWKKLHNVSGGTPDYLSLESVLQSITPEYAEELKNKTRRRVAVILSDGESHDPERTKRVLRELRKKGVIALGLGMTESGTAVKDTYAPDAEVIEDIKKLPQAVQKVILKYTQDL